MFYDGCQQSLDIILTLISKIEGWKSLTLDCMNEGIETEGLELHLMNLFKNYVRLYLVLAWNHSESMKIPGSWSLDCRCRSQCQSDSRTHSGCRCPLVHCRRWAGPWPPWAPASGTTPASSSWSLTMSSLTTLSSLFWSSHWSCCCCIIVSLLEDFLNCNAQIFFTFYCDRCCWCVDICCCSGHPSHWSLAAGSAPVSCWVSPSSLSVPWPHWSLEPVLFTPTQFQEMTDLEY